MPHFDWTLSLGSVVSFCGAVIVAVYTVSVVKTKMDFFLEQHTTDIRAARIAQDEHAHEDDARFKALSDQMLNLTGNVQRLIGQMEGIVYRQDRQEPRSGRRTTD